MSLGRNKTIRNLAKVLVDECRSKHLLHPFEKDLNDDYNVTLTISIKEARQFILACLGLPVECEPRERITPEELQKILDEASDNVGTELYGDETRVSSMHDDKGNQHW